MGSRENKMKLFPIIPQESQNRVAYANLATVRNRRDFAVFLTKVSSAPGKGRQTLDCRQ